MLKKGDRLIIYSNPIMEVVSEPQSAGHEISVALMKPALLKRLPEKIFITVESIIGVGISYNEAVSKLIVRETCLDTTGAGNENALSVEAKKPQGSARAVNGRDT